MSGICGMLLSMRSVLNCNGYLTIFKKIELLKKNILFCFFRYFYPFFQNFILR